MDTINGKNAVSGVIAGLYATGIDEQDRSVKTLCEIGFRRPGLIMPHADAFIGLLGSKNSRVRRGSMLALNHIAGHNAHTVYLALSRIGEVAANGTVTMKDNYVAILVKLCRIKQYTDDAFALLNEQLLSCAPNQLPMYAENAFPVVTTGNKDAFIDTLTSRLDGSWNESKRRRLETVIRIARRI